MCTIRYKHSFKGMYSLPQMRFGPLWVQHSAIFLWSFGFFKMFLCPTYLFTNCLVKNNIPSCTLCQKTI